MNALPTLPLRTLAPAKINLGLFVGPVRGDGRHELVQQLLPCRLVVRGSTGPSPDTARR